MECKLLMLCHTSLNNSIERAFGVLKKHFLIIENLAEPHYGLQWQKGIIFICCILHNYLIRIDLGDTILAQVDDKVEEEAYKGHHRNGENNEETTHREIIRDAIEVEMWINYVKWLWMVRVTGWCLIAYFFNMNHQVATHVAKFF